MSNLDRDIREALRLGYGVRYGKYKADHPHGTAPEQEDARPDNARPDNARQCKECDCVFVPHRHNQLYCCGECARRRAARDAKRRYLAKRAAAKEEDTEC